MSAPSKAFWLTLVALFVVMGVLHFRGAAPPTPQESIANSTGANASTNASANGSAANSSALATGSAGSLPTNATG